VSTRAEDQLGASDEAASLVERFMLKALVESCLVLEEGVASLREIDLDPSAGEPPVRANVEIFPSW